MNKEKLTNEARIQDLERQVTALKQLIIRMVYSWKNGITLGDMKVKIGSYKNSIKVDIDSIKTGSNSLYTWNGFLSEQDFNNLPDLDYSNTELKSSKTPFTYGERRGNKYDR